MKPDPELPVQARPPVVSLSTATIEVSGARVVAIGFTADDGDFTVGSEPKRP